MFENLGRYDMTDGNTYAINRHLKEVAARDAENEAIEQWRDEKTDEIYDNIMEHVEYQFWNMPWPQSLSLLCGEFRDKEEFMQFDSYIIQALKGEVDTGLWEEFLKEKIKKYWATAEMAEADLSIEDV